MNTTKQLTIAIDGYSSCGKSTLAKALAKKLNYIFVDSGAMYRGIALYCLQKKLIKGQEIDTVHLISSLQSIDLKFIYNEQIQESELFLNGINVAQEIRKPDVAAIVSQVASIEAVRVKLVEMQQEMGLNGGIIMDGRDIGTVVFPFADLKLFVTADPKVRAERRYKEMLVKDPDTNIEEVEANLIARDKMDTTRAISPLVRAEDALILDNTHMDREMQLDYVLKLLKEKELI
jgi:cytidylate kinase